MPRAQGARRGGRWEHKPAEDVGAMMWNDDGYRMHDQGGAGWLMVVLMLVLVVAVVLGVLAFVRGTTTVAGTPRAALGGPVSDARRILQERFARGDIDEDDYRKRMRALDDTSPGSA
jgi:putative membrane protein